MKPFWKSRTFMAVVAGAAVIIIQWLQGTTWIPPAWEGVIGLGVGLLLRFLTDSGVYIPGITKPPA